MLALPPGHARRFALRGAALLVMSAPVACRGSNASGEPIDVMNAASISRPVRSALDSFQARSHTRYAQNPGATLEIVRRITELGQRPDVILLADADVFPKLLVPRYAAWYAIFGRNRMVIAYTPQSRGAEELALDASRWRDVLIRPGVEVGRADPNTDPSGYRTLLVFDLAERHYREPGLAKRLLAVAPERNVRPREADQVALLQTHQLDYIWTYQNLADDLGLRYVLLPADVDLSEPADTAVYAQASTRVVGKRPGDTITVRGAPITYAVSIPAGAPHPDDAKRFVDFLLSPEGARALRAAHFDALDHPVTVGHRP